MRINRFKLLFFVIPILLPILLFFVFKKNIINNIIESSVKKNGGEIKIEHLSTPLFSNSYTFKGVIHTKSSDIKLDEITRDYDLFTTSKAFKYIIIVGGEIKFKEIGQEKFPGKFPNFNLVSIKNFDVIFSTMLSKDLKFRIDDLELHDLSQEEIVPKFSFVRLKITFANSKIQIDSRDGKTVKISSNLLNIEDIRQFLPTYTSIIKSAIISIEAESKYPELHEDGHIKFKIQIKDFKMKDENLINFIEKMYSSNLQYKLEAVKKEGVLIEFKIDKKNYNKSPTVIMQEFQSKLINEIFTQILKL